MRTHFSNAAYGVLDYAAYPLGMLAVTPILLKTLGIAQYGVWTVVTAAVSTGGILASGFGDANIRHVARARGMGNPHAVLRAVRSMMGINLLLGLAIALVSWALIPFASRHLAGSAPNLLATCQWSFRMACVLMLVRAIESVCISTQRAFERYGAAVGISIAVRLSTLAAAAIVAPLGFGVIGIMIITSVLMLLGTSLQLYRLGQYLRADSLMPRLDPDATAALWSFGAFSWLQAVAAVMFGQADRLLLGLYLGATTVAAYTLCVQMAQPIYGIASAGLHFLFPHLAARQTELKPGATTSTIAKAFSINLLFVTIATSLTLFFGVRLLRLWVGRTIAESAASILTPIVLSFALLGISVTGYYSLLAFSRVRTVAWTNIGGGVAMLLLMIWFLPHYGTHGLAMARVGYGAITLFMYYPLSQELRRNQGVRRIGPDIGSVCEDA